MSTDNNSPVARYARWVIRWRFPVLLGSLAVVVAAASGGHGQRGSGRKVTALVQYWTNLE